MTLFTIFQALYFMLPAYLANMTPVFAAYFGVFKSLNVPIDGGKTFRRKRIFGDHKTVRGFVLGTLVGALVFVFQKMISPSAPSLSLMPFTSLDYAETIVLGFLFGFGAMFGDAAKSFFKRRLDIPEGNAWPIADQLDFVIGALIFLSPFFMPSRSHLLVIFLVTPILHLLSNIIGYKLKLKNVWW